MTFTTNGYYVAPGDVTPNMSPVNPRSFLDTYSKTPTGLAATSTASSALNPFNSTNLATSGSTQDLMLKNQWDSFDDGASKIGSSQEGGIGSWFADKGNMNMIGVGAGIGQMGLGLASFLQQKDLAKKQGRLLDQQLEHNRYEMDNRKALQASLNN